MAVTALRSALCARLSCVLLHILCRKTLLRKLFDCMRFRLPLKIKAPFRVLLVEMAVTALRSALCARLSCVLLHILCRKALLRKLFDCMRFRLPLKKIKHPFGCFFGGDGGNRNRVLKSFIGAFYMLSLLFGDSPHETAANSLFATVGSDT